MKKYKATIELTYSEEDYPELTEDYALELAIDDIARSNFDIEIEEQ